MDKIRVAVLYGGRSAEHEVSLRSAANVIQHLDPNLFDVIPIGIDKYGNWFLGEEVFAKSLAQNTVPLLSHHSHAWFTPAWLGRAMAKQQVAELSNHEPNALLFDVVFPVVHGPLCEDGTLQGLLELANLPYVGCGVLSSAIGMDKDVSKRLVMNGNIPVAPFIVIKQSQWQRRAAEYITQVSQEISYPVFVKPANTGSSIGITKVRSANDLRAAIDDAFRFDTKVIIEKALNVVELELAVLESLDEAGEPIVSVTGEVKPHHEFYSYDAKYCDEEGASLIIPASLPPDINEQARVCARKIFQLLECEGMARVDLFFDKDTQQLVFNEINTIPGFTQISMYPKLMDASGVSYSQLLTHLIQLALRRHQYKKSLARTYLETEPTC